MNDKTQIVRREMLTPSNLQVREADGVESRTIEGYAILFDTPSEPLWADDEGEGREVIATGAVTRALLDASDIKMTMFHNRQLILARSKGGVGTLSYNIDERGVKFSFDAPHTVDGDKALELVKRGDLSGCSFAFSTRYYDTDFVSHEISGSNVTYRVKVITALHDFTITDCPAYQATSVEARDFADTLRAPGKPTEEREKIREQLREMRAAADSDIIF